MVNLTINGEKISIPDGSTVLDAAQKAGIHIPTLCNHPDLTPYGACRLCVVAVNRNGRSTITTSCNCPAEEGIIVETETAEVQQTRKTMAELMLSRCPEVPSIQRAAAALGVDEPAFTTDKPEEDCILCGLCVRACDEIAEEHILGFVDRASNRYVSTAFEKRYDVCDTCNKCVPYCPTGAITTLPAPQIGKAFKKEANKWIRIRQVFQYSVFTIFLGLMAATLFGNLLPVPINIFSRLNPLQALTSMIGSRGIIANFWPVLITIGVTLVFGRVWCGWFCPLGAGLELYGKKGRRFKWQNLRKFKYVILGVVIVMAAFGSLAFMYFEPITIFVRGLTTIFKPLLSYIQLEDKKDFVWPAVTWWFIAIPFVLVLLLNLVEKRFWCRYLCPLGALVGFLSKFSWIKRRIDKFSCVQCGDCASSCTMGAISPEKEFESDPAECIMCMDCAKPCPKLAITYEKGKMGGWNFEFDPGRREAIETIGLGAVAVGMLGFDVGNVKAAKGTVLRPPGAQGDDFLSKCIRCDQCIEVCPNHALQPAALEAGWDSLFTPVLDPFSGGCAYDCNRCGQVCPSQAIPPLTLEEKRKAVIGLAQVNFAECVRCMDCKDNCPYDCFELVTVEGERGVFPKVKDVSDCVGCGICVDICPEQETRAIVVFPLGAVPESPFKTEIYIET